MRKYLASVCLIIVSVYGQSQRTAEFVSLQQIKESNTVYYELQMRLDTELKADEQLLIDEAQASSSNNFIAIIDGKNLIFRTTPEYTTGRYYATLFQSLHIDTLVHRHNDEVTEVQIAKYLQKINN